MLQMLWSFAVNSTPRGRAVELVDDVDDVAVAISSSPFEVSFETAVMVSGKLASRLERQRHERSAAPARPARRRDRRLPGIDRHARRQAAELDPVDELRGVRVGLRRGDPDDELVDGGACRIS